MTHTPGEENPSFRPTLNKNGWMLCKPDATMCEWIDFGKAQPFPVLDVGATYGIATLEALRAGCEVIATDLDRRHLDEIVESARIEGLDNRLTCIAGTFPEQPDLEPRSIGAVLLSRVITFMEPSHLRAAFRRVAACLAPSGKVFGTADSPFLANFTGFRTEFERRLAHNEEWPGWLPDTEPYVSANKGVTARSVHLFTPEVISRELLQAGFEIERVDYIDRAEYPSQFQSGGRESVRFIAGLL